MAESPYRRIPVPAEHFACPNCNCVTHKTDLAPVTHACIVRYFQKQNRLQREAVLRSRGAALDAAEALEVLRKDDVAWVPMPPVLKRLGCETLNNLKPRLLQKKTAVCPSCFSMFADVIEMHHQEEPKVDKPQKHDWFTGTKRPDRGLDFVFSDQSALHRYEHLQRQKKHETRRLVFGGAPSIEWTTVKAQGHVGREIRTLLRDGAAGLDALDSREMLIARSRRADKGDESMQLVPLAELSVAAGPSPTAHQDNSANEEEAAQALAAVINSADQQPDTLFDVPMSQALMFELWTLVTNECSFSTPCALEDVPASDPNFHVYSQNRLRFSPPPSTRLALPPAPSVMDSTLLPGTAAAKALSSASAVVDELTSEERALLSKVIEPGTSIDVTLTNHDLALIDGEDDMSAVDSEIYSDEGSEFDDADEDEDFS